MMNRMLRAVYGRILKYERAIGLLAAVLTLGHWGAKLGGWIVEYMDWITPIGVLVLLVLVFAQSFRIKECEVHINRLGNGIAEIIQLTMPLTMKLDVSAVRLTRMVQILQATGAAEDDVEKLTQLLETYERSKQATPE